MVKTYSKYNKKKMFTCYLDGLFQFFFFQLMMTIINYQESMQNKLPSDAGLTGFSCRAIRSLEPAVLKGFKP